MDRFRNLRIQNKLFLSFGIIVSLVIILAIFILIKINSMEDMYDELVNGPLQRETYIADAIGDLTEIRRFILSRGYLDDDDLVNVIYANYYYDTYQESAKSFTENINNYHESLLRDTRLSAGEKQMRLDSVSYIENLFDGVYRQYISDIHEASLRKDKGQVSTLLSEVIPIGDVLADKLGELREAAMTLADTRVAETKAFSDSSKSLAASIAFLIAILSLVVSVFMSKAIKAPIVSMEKSMAEISKGNLAYPIRSVYKDELGMLSNRIGDMVDTIAELNKTVAIVDYLDSMICVTDLSYNMLYINRKLADAYCVDMENYINEKCHKAMRDLDEPCEFCPLPELTAEKENYPSLEYEFRWDEYLGAWLSGSSSVIRWVDGTLVQFCIIRDDTLKKEHAERQKQHEEAMREAMLAAETSSRAKSAFLANMSHEIRTPMNSIVGFSELAMNGEVSPKTRDYLVKIAQSSEGLLQIINDILDISKIESGKIELEHIPFSLHGVFRLCQTAIMPKALEKGITLYCYAEPSIGKKLVGDPTRLRQALINILSNAVKFTNSGVVKLLSSVESLSDDRIIVHFEVKDSGIGMTPEQIARIFDPFMQGDSTTTRKYGGTGLGLAITKNIVELMGGCLEVKSEPGLGSKFSFDLEFDTVDAPVEDSGREEEEAEHLIPAFEGVVLVCEDNRMNQQVLCEHLSRAGLDTEVAVNGKEGVEKVQRRIENGEKPFDLILMDIHMPVMDGLEAASRLARIGSKTPIIAITANIMSNDRETYREHGMPDCVAKPFTSQELWDCLLKYLKPLGVKTVDETARARADEKLHNQLLSDFVRDHRNTAADIRKAVDEGDIKLAHRLAHTLKGVAGLIGRTDLREAAHDVERGLSDGKAELSRDGIDALEIALNTALGELAPLLEESRGRTLPAGALDPERARELLETLEPLLRTGNPECLEMIGDLRAISGSDRLIEQMEDFDFRPALKTLAGIKRSLGVQ